MERSIMKDAVINVKSLGSHPSRGVDDGRPSPYINYADMHCAQYIRAGIAREGQSSRSCR